MAQQLPTMVHRQQQPAVMVDAAYEKQLACGTINVEQNFIQRRQNLLVALSAARLGFRLQS
eukprot:235962-Pleurochrysis_carterae.AAC.6